MKLIKLTKTMEEKLNNFDEFSMEMVSYLTYTQNYYVLEKDGVKEITNERVTLLQLQSRMDLTEFSAYILDREEAEEALNKVAAPTPAKVESKAKVETKPKTNEEKKAEPKKKTKANDKKKSDK